MYYLVYRITNTVNGKSYIGCHKTNDKDDDYFGSGKLLKAAIKKYGKEKFTKEILCEFNNAEAMFEKEAELVTIGPTSYNLKHGGEGGWDHLQKRLSEIGRLGYSKGLKHLQKSERRKIGIRSGRNSQRAKTGLFDSKYDDMRSEWAGNAFLGKHHTETTKRKIGLANSKRKGRSHHNFGKRWIHNPWTKENKMILKTEPIPDNWISGRRRI